MATGHSLPGLVRAPRWTDGGAGAFSTAAGVLGWEGLWVAAATMSECGSGEGGAWRLGPSAWCPVPCIPAVGDALDVSCPPVFLGPLRH